MGNRCQQAVNGALRPAWHDDQELFTTPPADRVCVSKGVLCQGGKPDQHLITNLMSMDVIDLFEMVQVNQGHAKARRADATADGFMIKDFMQMLSVVQTCQRVSGGEALDFSDGQFKLSALLSILFAVEGVVVRLPGEQQQDTAGSRNDQAVRRGIESWPAPEGHADP